MGLNVCQATDQRRAALKLANHVRTTNARTLREIAALPMVDGYDRVIALLREGDEKGPLGAIPVGRLLGAPKWMGVTKVNALLRAAQVMSADRDLRSLTIRQRVVLAVHLERPEILWPDSTVRRRKRVAA